PQADAHARLRDLPDQLRQQLHTAAALRKGTITLQVRPEKLGQVDVKLDFGNDSAVRVSVTADSPEALEVLKAEARGLERALQEAGLRTDDSSLSFQLRGEGQQAQQQAAQDGRGRNGQGGTAAGSGEAEASQSPDAEALAAARAAARGGVDVKV
ncbi:MAG: flagellar hook-length control protein FliK, partial [Caenispirillum sp.]|nr:flagellar hook-length control protein FliK [Caenispirillum sp.]